MSTPLETRLYLPELPSGTPARLQLLQRLSAGLRTRLVLICAPAGAGKTTLAVGWLHSLMGPGQAGGGAASVAWYTVDSSDNDLASFTSYVTAAIRRSCPDLLPGWIDLDRRVSMPEPEEVAAEVIAALAPAAGHLFLALDDYHLVVAPAVHRFTAYFLRHLPPLVHVVITSRYEPPIGIPKLRARRQVVELGDAELALSLEEATAFLRSAIGDDIDPADAAMLWQQTEGWLAGLKLAAIALQMGRSRQQFMRGFAQASTPSIGDYLVSQALAAQPEPVHDFLLQSSILSVLSRELCAAVVLQHRYAGSDILDYLRRHHMFLFPLDDFDEWYRYHGQFRTLLRRRLVSLLPADEIAGLHRRAAVWLAGHGHLGDAVGHYVAAGDADAAAALVESLIPDLLRREEWYQCGRYLAVLPRETIQRRPALLLLRAWTCVHDYDLAQILPLIDQAESLLEAAEEQRDGPGSTEPAVLYGQIHALRTRAGLGRAPWEVSRAHGQNALRLLPPVHGWARSYTYNALGIAELVLTGYAASRRMLDTEIVVHAGERTEYRVRLYFALSNLNYSAGMSDEFALSASHFDRLVHELAMPAESQVAQFMLGLVQLERNDLQGGYERLAAVADRPDLTHLWVLRMTAYRLLERYAEQKQAREGEALLTVLRQRQDKSPNAEGAAEIDALEAFWAALTGDSPAAERYLRRSVFDTPFLHFANRGLVRIRICHALGRPGRLAQATELGWRLADAGRKYNHGHIEINALVLLAQTYWLRDLPVPALAALRRAIGLGYRRGYRRTLCTPEPLMGTMLHQLAAEAEFAGPASHLLDEIARLDRLKSGMLPHLMTGSDCLQIDDSRRRPLSSRESAILSLLATNRTYQAIADDLNMSLHTVRNHITSIYRKLGVHNRHAALERVRRGGQAAAAGDPAGEGETGSE